MAEAGETILTCPLCEDTYKDPRVLPCQHSFCLGCLRQYIEGKHTQMEPSLTCPVCRNPCKLPTEGAKGFHPNVLLNQLLEMPITIQSFDSPTSTIVPLCSKHQEALVKFCEEKMCLKSICSSCVEHASYSTTTTIELPPDVTTSKRQVKYNITKTIMRPRGRYALHSVVEQGDVHLLNMVIDEFEVDCMTPDGKTAFMLASLAGHTEMLDVLAKKGANVFHVTDNKENALHRAAEGGSVEAAKTVVRLWINHPSSEGLTSLMIAAMQGSRDMLSVLVDHGADVNLTATSTGNTALHLAILHEHHDSIKYLLEKGADPQIQNKLGITALDYINRMSNFQLKERLLEFLHPPADQEPSTGLRDNTSSVRQEGVCEHLDIYKAPQLLLKTEADGKVSLNKKFLSQLRRVKTRLVVVSVVGPCRTGKSYLLNRFSKACNEGISELYLRRAEEEKETGNERVASQEHVEPGEIKGFKIGKAIRTTTKGVWIWLRKHPQRENCHVILMDTEGLGDPRKEDRESDTWNFVFATLLSCVVVYNAMRDITDHPLSTIGFIADISKTIVAESGKPVQLDLFFPRFVYVLRDFVLSLTDDDGIPMDSDTYLEDCLKVKDTNNKDKKKEFNLVGQCIRQYFTNRKCFTIKMPSAENDILQNLGDIPDCEISKDFLEQVRKLCDEVIHKTQPKSSITGDNFTGEIWADLAEGIVEVINKGDIPVVDQTLQAVYDRQNKRAYNDGYTTYCQVFGDVMAKFPLSEKELAEVHRKASAEASKVFHSKAIYVEKDDMIQEMSKKMVDAWEVMKKKNSEAWLHKCQKALENRPKYKELKDNLARKAYHQSGYDQFMCDVNEIENQLMDLEDYDENQMRLVFYEFRVKVLHQPKEDIMAHDALRKNIKEKELEQMERELQEAKDAADQAYKDTLQKEMEAATKIYTNDNMLKKKVALQHVIGHLESLISSHTKNLNQLDMEQDPEKARELEEHIDNLKQKQKKHELQLQEESRCAIM